MLLEPAHHLRTLTDDVAVCGELARRVDHLAPLSHLPGWRVVDCLAHLVGDLRWANVDPHLPGLGPTRDRARPRAR